jgi:hypothetical protein
MFWLVLMLLFALGVLEGYLQIQFRSQDIHGSSEGQNNSIEQNSMCAEKIEKRDENEWESPKLLMSTG